MKYKKCPYCDLNYIPLTDYCCKVCYATSQKARLEAISQRMNEYEEKRNREKQQQQLREKQIQEMKEKQEIEDKNKLLNLWEKFGFIGFLHTTNFDNFISIYKSGFLKSRNQLISEGFVFEDNAETSVLEKTLGSIKSKVRFYYRPITPTNISAYITHNQKNPVMIVLNKDAIFEKDVLFCDGGAGSNLTVGTKNAKEAINFKWEEVFGVGPFNSDDFILKNHRNAEFLINSPISLDKVVKFYFRNYSDYVNACELFGKDARFEHNPKLFY